MFCAKPARMDEIGSLSLMTTVRASGAVIETTGAAGLTSLTRSKRLVPVAFQRFQENRTSWASRLRPLSGAWVGGVPTLGRIFRVKVVLSGENSHDSAISGSIVPSLVCRTPGLTLSRRLKINDVGAEAGSVSK